MISPQWLWGPAPRWCLWPRPQRSQAHLHALRAFPYPYAAKETTRLSTQCLRLLPVSVIHKINRHKYFAKSSTSLIAERSLGSILNADLGAGASTSGDALIVRIGTSHAKKALDHRPGAVIFLVPFKVSSKTIFYVTDSVPHRVACTGS
jgi:hypothetical protein